MDKHAYLIMAHNNFGILEKLLMLLDDQRNDIYIHVDKKVKDFDFHYFSYICKNATVVFMKKRIDVRWGSASQVKTEMLLFEEASKEMHNYYHLLSGVDLPLKTQNEIYSFFKNDDKEDLYCKPECSQWDYQRLSIYHFPKTWEVHILSYLYIIQEKLKIDRIKNNGMKCCKGYNWCSITHDAVQYLLQRKKFIKKITRLTVCADEVYKQYLLYNSEFFGRIYRNDKNCTDDLREVDWEQRVGDSPHVYTKIDYDKLVNSSKLFARKFDEKVDYGIIELIYEYIKERTEYENRHNNNL